MQSHKSERSNDDRESFRIDRVARGAPPSRRPQSPKQLDSYLGRPVQGGWPPRRHPGGAECRSPCARTDVQHRTVRADRHGGRPAGRLGRWSAARRRRDAHHDEHPGRGHRHGVCVREGPNHQPGAAQRQDRGRRRARRPRALAARSPRPVGRGQHQEVPADRVPPRRRGGELVVLFADPKGKERRRSISETRLDVQGEGL